MKQEIACIYELNNIIYLGIANKLKLKYNLKTKNKKGILIWKTEVWISAGHSLSSTKILKIWKYGL